MKVRDVRARLQAGAIDVPDLEARILLEDIARISFTQSLSDPEREIEPEISSKLSAVIQRRLAGEPLSRILGYRDFYGRRFYLSRETLDPRPDTETLIEAVLEEKWDAPRILDLGTGTGCILLTLLHEITGSTGVGVDLSADACATARRNAQNQNLSDRVAIRNVSWTDGLEGKFDLIVSNPPYIPSSIIPTLSPEVQNHDPILALDGGNDGLDPYKYLLSELKKFLVPGGFIFFEIGYNQLPGIERLVRNVDATLIQWWRDLNGQPRVVKISYGDK